MSSQPERRPARRSPGSRCLGNRTWRFSDPHLTSDMKQNRKNYVDYRMHAIGPDCRGVRDRVGREGRRLGGRASHIKIFSRQSRSSGRWAYGGLARSVIRVLPNSGIVRGARRRKAGRRTHRTSPSLRRRNRVSKAWTFRVTPPVRLLGSLRLCDSKCRVSSFDQTCPRSSEHNAGEIAAESYRTDNESR